MHQDLLNYINQTILRQAAGLQYIVKSEAPSTETDLFNSTGLIIWSGASDNTIYKDASVNYAFRALHDALHLKTGLNFSVDAEIELGRRQASKYMSDVMRELVYSEVALQAEFYKINGIFVADQVKFTLNILSKYTNIK